MQPIQHLAPVQSLIDGADHVDVKTVESHVSLREFAAGFINYYPGWVKALYQVRRALVRLLGMRQNGVPRQPAFRPEDIPMTDGAKIGFFRIERAVEDRYIMAGIRDTHLDGYLVIAVEPLGVHRRRFYVATIVRYNKWTGPVYFNLIRPFHHLVVGHMVQAGARGYGLPPADHLPQQGHA